MITLHAYWMGRDVTHAEELTDEIQRNAQVTVDRVNELLARAGRSDIHELRSGWRPQSIDAALGDRPAPSRHITAEASDLPDGDRSLATWCVDNLDVLEELGLWMEDPRWTPTWVHFQTQPPKSGKLVFIPSSAKPLDPDFPVTWA